MTAAPLEPAARQKNPRTAFAAVIGLDFVAPLVLFYGLRVAGVNTWLALVLGAALPLVRLTYKIATERRVEALSLLTLAMVVCATAVGMATGDVRLLLARESYFTALVGLWMAGTAVAGRPFIFEATVRLLPEATAQSWREDWQNSAEFRRVMYVLTIAWGTAFLLDAVARIVMAYTLPVDSVPLLSVLLLAAMLVAVVQLSKAYGRRLMGNQNRYARSRTSTY